ncbi:MAG: 1,4-dihydroxy-2-naphthoyl-CoA hydrolase [Candidatus Heimdallarchaeota archaeon LC_3]|nr:MAG: 1,4-dihydroxy-2-naphthoyl-CoA hydrolase [Candidatus Heimdallarchaeota archaeon LC_3]
MHKTSISIRFRDTDSMGHVNNAVFLTYLELARIEFFKKFSLTVEGKDISFILAKVDIDFKIPITLSDQPEVLLDVKSVGTTSWWFKYKIVESTKPEKIYAVATSVQVVYNYEKNEKEKIPDIFKEILESQVSK